MRGRRPQPAPIASPGRPPAWTASKRASRPACSAALRPPRAARRPCTPARGRPRHRHARRAACGQRARACRPPSRWLGGARRAARKRARAASLDPRFTGATAVASHGRTCNQRLPACTVCALVLMQWLLRAEGTNAPQRRSSCRCADSRRAPYSCDAAGMLVAEVAMKERPLSCK